MVAYLVQQLLLFPIAELDPILWLAAGVLLATPAPATAPGSRQVDASWVLQSPVW